MARWMLAADGNVQNMDFVQSINVTATGSLLQVAGLRPTGETIPLAGAVLDAKALGNLQTVLQEVRLAMARALITDSTAEDVISAVSIVGEALIPFQLKLDAEAE